MKTYTVFIDSALWLCGSNLISCSMIYRYLVENGHLITYSASDADFIIINSCGAVKELKDQSIGLFYKYNSLIKEKARIIMFGCLVKIDEDLIHSMDLIPIGYDERHKLDDFFYTKKKINEFKPHCDDEIKNSLTTGKKSFISAELPIFYLSKLFRPFVKKIRTNYKNNVEKSLQSNKIFIEISRGCINNCYYCSIKKAKGKVKSRKIEDIIFDIKRLYGPLKNISLVSDDCGCYGIDIGTNFFELLYEIKKEFPDISIDVDNLNPNWLEKEPEKYIKLVQNINFNFLRIPFQSGSNKILKNMNRPYDVRQVLKIINQIKKISPKTTLLTHFIIGYPGETFIDFYKSLSAAKHFDYPITFKFSKNIGTVSASLPNQKTQFTISMRNLIFLLFSNIVILFNFLTSSTFSQD